VRAISYLYNDKNELTEVRDALQNACKYKYEDHLLVRFTNRIGLSFHYEYDRADSNARCIHTWGAV